jgi:hypothetical protein
MKSKDEGGSKERRQKAASNRQSTLDVFRLPLSILSSLIFCGRLS